MSDNHIKFREGDDYFVQHMKHFHLLFFFNASFHFETLCICESDKYCENEYI